MSTKRTFSLAVSALSLFTLFTFSACAKQEISPPEPWQSSPSASAPLSSEDGLVSALPEELPAETPDPPSSSESSPSPSSSVRPTTPDPVEERTDYAVVLVSDLNIRSGAGTSYSALATAQKGEYFPVLGKQNGFYKTYYRGKTAYLSAGAKYTSSSSLVASSPAVEKVLQEGYKTLGTPYVYGAVRYHDGTGTKYKGFTQTKFDCSSLMQYIFYEGAGVLLNENTRTQVKQGTVVTRSNIRRGDLLFFTNDSRRNNTGIERIGHVALYLGDNKILHTASDYAKIEEISSKRWSYFITARRVL